MTQHIALTALLVTEYDAAIAFYVGQLGFELIEDRQLTPSKRWVVVAPRGGGGGLLLAKAANHRQRSAVGDQAGGRVFLFLTTADFERDYAAYRAVGVRFVESPRKESYGDVVVFEDPFGNRWDLIQPL